MNPLTILSNCQITTADPLIPSTLNPVTNNPTVGGSVVLTCYLKLNKSRQKPYGYEERSNAQWLEGFIIDPYPYVELISYNQKCVLVWTTYGQKNIGGEFVFAPQPTIAGQIVEPITGRRIAGWYTIKN